jgi:hypothetical protein
MFLVLRIRNRLAFFYLRSFSRAIFMTYSVTITQTTGKHLEEWFFNNLESAKVYHRHAVAHTTHQRVLVLLLEKPDTEEEKIVAIEFVDGISYNRPKAGSLPDQESAGQPSMLTTINRNNHPKMI